MSACTIGEEDTKGVVSIDENTVSTTIFDEVTYTKIAQGDVELSDAVNKVQERIPMRIFVG